MTETVRITRLSVEESEDLTTDMVLSGLNVVHDTLVGGKDDIAELSGWQNLVNELLEILKLEVESWGDDTALVQSTVELNDDFARSLIIDDLELIDVAVLLHNFEELNNDLGYWSEENLKIIYIRKSDRDQTIGNHHYFVSNGEHLLFDKKTARASRLPFFKMSSDYGSDIFKTSRIYMQPFTKKEMQSLLLTKSEINIASRSLDIYLSFASFFSIDHLLEAFA